MYMLKRPNTPLHQNSAEEMSQQNTDKGHRHQMFPSTDRMQSIEEQQGSFMSRRQKNYFFKLMYIQVLSRAFGVIVDICEFLSALIFQNLMCEIICDRSRT